MRGQAKPYHLFMTRFVIVVAVILAITLTATSNSYSAPIAANFAGVLVDGPALDGTVNFASQVRIMKANGVGWIRLPVSWAEVEPSPGDYQFNKLDAMITAAAANNIEVMPIVIHAPYWAAEKPIAINSRPQDPRRYGSFLGVLANRYGSKGSLWQNRGLRYKPINRWQIWNEPDLDYAWRSSGKVSWPVSYTALLRAARSGLRSADPRAKIVLGGLSNHSWRSLRLIYQAGGRSYFDIAALHPFASRPDGVIERVRQLRREMSKWGDGKKPLILSEISWSSSNGKAIGLTSKTSPAWDTSELGQAERASQIIKTLAQNRSRLKLQSFAWATWLSPELGSKYWFHYTGLNRMRAGKVAAKPSLRAFRQTVISLRTN